MYANLPPTPEENTTSFGGKGPKLQNSHRFPLFYVKGTGSHTRIKKQEPRGCWTSKSAKKATAAKPNGPRQSCKKQNHCWPLSLPLASGVCDEIPQFRRAGAVFVGTAFDLSRPLRCSLLLLLPTRTAPAQHRHRGRHAAWLACWNEQWGHRRNVGLATEDFLCLKSQLIPWGGGGGHAAPCEGWGHHPARLTSHAAVVEGQKPLSKQKKVKENVENGNCWKQWGLIERQKLQLPGFF